MRTILAALALLVALFAPLLAAPSRGAAQDEVPRCRAVRPGFVQCTETSIVGRRPSAYFLLGRARDRYEPAPLVRRGGPAELARVVRAAPF